MLGDVNHKLIDNNGVISDIPANGAHLMLVIGEKADCITTQPPPSFYKQLSTTLHQFLQTVFFPPFEMIFKATILIIVLMFSNLLRSNETSLPVRTKHFVLFQIHKHEDQCFERA